MNTLIFLQSVYNQFSSQSFDITIFGWWAEELQWVFAPRAHNDIDMFLIDTDFSRLDLYIQSSHEFIEILPKKFPHKRAVIYDWVMIEFFLVTNVNDILTTNFFDIHLYNWWNIKIIKNVTTWWHKLKVVDKDIVAKYREKYAEIEHARTAYLHA